MKDFPWGYLIGAAVTVLGLLINQRRADQREVDRWNKDTARDSAKWDRYQAERSKQWQQQTPLSIRACATDRISNT
jgi:hypothetical protein